MRVVVVVLFLLFVPGVRAQTALTITTEPNAGVWVDEIRRGTTDASGKLVVSPFSSRRHTLRVRAQGFLAHDPLFSMNHLALRGLSRNRGPHAQERIVRIDGAVLVMPDHVVAPAGDHHSGVQIRA